jgi:hypothetical protein
MQGNVRYHRLQRGILVNSQKQLPSIMRLIKPLLFSLFITGMISGCGKTEETTETPKQVDPAVQKLHDEVIAVHDEVMPHMGELVALQTTLSQAAGTLPSPLSDSLSHVVQRLEKADDAMMSWMRQFQPMLDTSNIEVAKEYYGKQLEQVTEMRTLMTQALEEGQVVRDNLSRSSPFGGG